MKKSLLAGWLVAACIPALSPAEEKPILLQGPALSATQIAFSYGDDLWTSLPMGR